jgi:hypothetical protein
MKPRAHPAPDYRAALDAARPSLPDIALALELPLSTLASYHNGFRQVPPRVQGLTAVYLRTHAARLLALADALDAAALAPTASDG